jgi:hypothetical protein
MLVVVIPGTTASSEQSVIVPTVASIVTLAMPTLVFSAVARITELCGAAR